VQKGFVTGESFWDWVNDHVGQQTTNGTVAQLDELLHHVSAPIHIRMAKAMKYSAASVSAKPSRSQVNGGKRAIQAKERSTTLPQGNGTMPVWWWAA
jgi:hypothetical protein